MAEGAVSSKAAPEFADELIERLPIQKASEELCKILKTSNVKDSNSIHKAVSIQFVVRKIPSKPIRKNIQLKYRISCLEFKPQKLIHSSYLGNDSPTSDLLETISSGFKHSNKCPLAKTSTLKDFIVDARDLNKLGRSGVSLVCSSGLITKVRRTNCKRLPVFALKVKEQKKLDDQYVKNFVNQLHRAARTVELIISDRGSTNSCLVGHSFMSPKKISENIKNFLKHLSIHLAGSLDNIRLINLNCDQVKIPLFLNNSPMVDIVTMKPKIANESLKSAVECLIPQQTELFAKNKKIITDKLGQIHTVYDDIYAFE